MPLPCYAIHVHYLLLLAVIYAAHPSHLTHLPHPPTPPFPTVILPHTLPFIYTPLVVGARPLHWLPYLFRHKPTTRRSGPMTNSTPAYLQLLQATGPTPPPPPPHALWLGSTCPHLPHTQGSHLVHTFPFPLVFRCHIPVTPTTACSAWFPQPTHLPHTHLLLPHTTHCLCLCPYRYHLDSGPVHSHLPQLPQFLPHQHHTCVTTAAPAHGCSICSVRLWTGHLPPALCDSKLYSGLPRGVGSHHHTTPHHTTTTLHTPAATPAPTHCYSRDSPLPSCSRSSSLYASESRVSLSVLSTDEEKAGVWRVGTAT